MAQKKISVGGGRPSKSYSTNKNAHNDMVKGRSVQLEDATVKSQLLLTP